MKLFALVYDRHWAGSTVIITSNPHGVMEEWRKQDHEYNLKGLETHDSTKYSYNPWIEEINKTKDIESFLFHHDIRMYDVVDGLIFETSGDM